MKKKILFCLVAILMVLFILLPMPVAPMKIRIYFGDLVGNDIRMYYTSDNIPVMTSEQMIIGDYDEAKKMVTISIDAQIVPHILNLRFDLPGNANQLLTIRDLTVSSAGFVKHRFNPAYFFEETNLIETHDIEGLSVSDQRGIAYIRTNGEDPYLIMSPELTKEVFSYKSRYRMTRFFICMFVVLCYFGYKKNPFRTEENEQV